MLFFVVANVSAQSGNSQCINAIQICLESPVTYPAATNAGAAEQGPDYGCLGSEPNPAWFAFRIGTPGSHNILTSNSTDRDLDFILFGPFTTLENNCANLTASNTADCSYAGGTSETINFTSINQGDYYLLMVTNFSNQATNVTFTQTAGTGTYDCNFTGQCLISLVSPISGQCDSLTNSFALTGSVFTFNAPSTGTLTLSTQGVSQTINAPFGNTVNFNLAGLPSNGTNGIVTATYSASPTCSGTGVYASPSGCLPCQASAIANGPVCEGQTLLLTTDYPALAQYEWTGPNNFTSNAANPTIPNVTSLATGVYTVLITGQNCVSEREIEVDVLSSPQVIINTVETNICEGDILFLGASDIPGADWSWIGPNEFSSPTRNVQINNVALNNAGLYILSASRAGCTGIPDSLIVNVFPKPVIQLIGDSIQTPGSAAVFSLSAGLNMTYYWNFYGDAAIMETRVYTSGGDSLIVFWQDREGEMRIEVIGEDENGCLSNPVYLPVYVSNSIGVEGISAESFKLFPNPSSEFLKIVSSTFHKHNFELIDLSGRLILAKTFEESTKQIDLSGINQGIYVVKFDGIKRLLSIVK